MQGLGGMALGWLANFLKGHSFQVILHSFVSVTRLLKQDMPQGSTLSPTLFNLYMCPLAEGMEGHGVKTVSYVDDMKLILTLAQDNGQAAEEFKLCLTDLANWMKNSCLRFSASTTDI